MEWAHSARVLVSGLPRRMSVLSTQYHGILCELFADARAQGDLDRILNSEQPAYGTIERSGGMPPRDEEELRREREALEHITAEAAEYALAGEYLCYYTSDREHSHMIDIVHPSQADLDQGLSDTAKQTRHQADDPFVEPARYQEDDDSEEAAWLEGLEEEGLKIQVPQRGTLAMDINLLRNTPQRKEAVY